MTELESKIDNLWDFITTTANNKELEGAIRKFVELKLESIIDKRVCFLRQWLNENRIKDVEKLVDNDDLKHWLMDKTEDEMFNAKCESCGKFIDQWNNPIGDCCECGYDPFVEE